MTKLFKRGSARPMSSSAAADRPKSTRSKTKAASISHPKKSHSMSQRTARDGIEQARYRASEDRDSTRRDASDVDANFDAADSEMGTAVLDALAGWRDETRDAVEAMSADTGPSGARQFATVLNRQRQVLEEVKTALTEMQRLIEACESDLKQKSEKEAAMALPSFASSFVPKGAVAAMQVPMQVSMAPVSAIWSMQKAALSGVGMWTKAAQDYHGMWLGAVQSMVPGHRASNGRDLDRQDRRNHD